MMMRGLGAIPSTQCLRKVSRYVMATCALGRAGLLLNITLRDHQMLVHAGQACFQQNLDTETSSGSLMQERAATATRKLNSDCPAIS